MTASKIAKEIERAQRKAQVAQRAANIKHFEATHDAWRAAARLPPFIRRSDGRIIGIFRMG